MLNESKLLELIKRQKETGLTITNFCSNEGIPKSSFYYWRKKLGKEPVNGFIPFWLSQLLHHLRDGEKAPCRMKTGISSQKMKKRLYTP